MYKGRNKKPAATESSKIEPKIELKREKNIHNLVESVQTVGDDDEDYTPQWESRMTRGSSKLSDQKSQARYAAVAETSNSDQQ
jgi:hypothetical protein